MLTRLVEDILQGKPFQAIALDSVPGEALRNATLLPPGCGSRWLLPAGRCHPSRRTVFPVAAAKTAEVDESLSPAERVRQVISQVTGYAPAQIGDDAEFERDLGIDTLKIMDIVIRLRGKVLPPRFTTFRQATSVRKVLSLAEAAPAGPSGVPVSGPKPIPHLRCYRAERLSPAAFRFRAGGRPAPLPRRLSGGAMPGDGGGDRRACG